MKIKVQDSDILTLENLKGKMIMLSDTPKVYIIVDFKIEEVEETIVKKKLFQEKQIIPVKQKYIVSLEIHAWHSTGKFLGTMADDSAEWVIRRDLYRVRQNWVDFCDQLRGFGFKVVKTSDVTLLEQAFEAGREYQEYKGKANLEEKSWDYTFAKWCEKNNIKNL